MGHSRSVEFPGPAGLIEGILQGREEDLPSRVGVVCHPHPLYGGTMHTKAVHRAARALEDRRHLVVRFNFRGVGSSAGVHDHGAGEVDDARAALDYVGSLQPGLPATLAGMSFGSWVALRLGISDPRADALIAIAAPVSFVDFGFLAGCAKPKLFIHGTSDEVAPFAAVEALWPRLAEPKVLERIEGASHLLVEHLDRVEAAIAAFVERLPGGRR